MSDEPSAWYIKARDTLYGPFGLERLRAFAAQGRFSARSLVSQSRGGTFRAAAEEPVLAALLQNASAPSAAAPEPMRRFVIFARTGEDSYPGFMDRLSQAGEAVEAMDNIWLLRAPLCAHRLRNTLSQALGPDDCLFIADASGGTSAWFNLGQPMDARIRQFWQQSA